MGRGYRSSAVALERSACPTSVVWCDAWWQHLLQAVRQGGRTAGRQHMGQGHVTLDKQRLSDAIQKLVLARGQEMSSQSVAQGNTTRGKTVTLEFPVFSDRDTTCNDTCMSTYLATVTVLAVYNVQWYSLFLFSIVWEVF